MSAIQLDQELAALHRIGAEPDCEGGRIAYAFGYAALDDEQRDFLFDITIDSDRKLHATIDFYTARGVPVGGFDVDAWEASKLHLEAPATRESFRETSRVCRALLNGRAVEFGASGGRS